MKWIFLAGGAVGGFVLGLAVARQYARNQVGDAIHDGLSKVNLEGGTIESVVKQIVVPLTAG